MPSRNRKKRYLQQQDDILSQENKAKARARYKADPEKKKASVRDSYKADPEKKKASVRDSYKVDPEKKKASVRDSYKADPKRRRPLYATATTQILNLSNLLKGSDIKRTDHPLRTAPMNFNERYFIELMKNRITSSVGPNMSGPRSRKAILLCIVIWRQKRNYI